MNNKFTLKQSAEEISQPIVELLSETIPSLGSEKVIAGDDQKEILKKIFPCLESWQVHQISFTNSRSTILKEIQHIKFNQLSYIVLFLNKIQSLEGMNRIWMPNFQQIFLNSNNITSIKPLRKGFWPKFFYLSLHRNKIQEGQVCEMVSSQINTINIEYDSESNPQCYEFRWLAKMKTEKIISVTIQNINRIEQVRVKEVLRKKFQNINI